MSSNTRINNDQTFLIFTQQQHQNHQNQIIKRTQQQQRTLQQNQRQKPVQPSQNQQQNQQRPQDDSSRKLRKRFTKEEDDHMLDVIAALGKKSIDWRVVESEMPKRSARQCRERYCNYLCKEKKKGNWTHEEDRLILKLFEDLGPRWVEIANSLERRTNIDCKNRHFTLVNKINKHGLSSIYEADSSSSSKHTDNDDYIDSSSKKRSNSKRVNKVNNDAAAYIPIVSSDCAFISNGEENNFETPPMFTTATSNNKCCDNNGTNGRICVFPSLFDLLNNAPIRPILEEGKFDPFAFIDPISLMNRGVYK